MSTSTLKVNMPVVYQSSVSSNTPVTFALGTYTAALLLVGDPNRTAAQSTAYVLYRSADPLPLVTSAYVSVTSDTSGNVTVTSTVYTTATVVVFK